MEFTSGLAAGDAKVTDLQGYKENFTTTYQGGELNLNIIKRQATLKQTYTYKSGIKNPKTNKYAVVKKAPTIGWNLD